MFAHLAYILLAVTNQGEPWLQIILGIIAASGGVLAAVLTYKSRKTVDSKLDQTVGIPNGHGPLMAQTGTLLQNQMQISQNVFDLSERLSEHIMVTQENLNGLHQKVDSLSERVNNHADWEEDLFSQTKPHIPNNNKKGKEK